MIAGVDVPLLGADGKQRGELRLSCVVGKESWNSIAAIQDLRGAPPDPTADAPDASGEAPVQLLEEVSYGYEISTPGLTVVALHPAELWSYTSNPSSGRLHANRSTGTVGVEVELSNGQTVVCELEIRSRKLSYRTDYRSMLRRIAEEAAELVQSAFAVSSITGLQPDTFSDPATLYQRFAFMQSLVTSPDVIDALHLIDRRPHHEHVESHREVDPSKSVRAGPHLARELVGAGRRQHSARPIAGLSMVPLRITERTDITTFDTVPNRFVKYVLTRWRDLAEEVAALMTGSTAVDARGEREARATADLLERTLQSPAMKDAGRLTSFPQSNQVLQGRAGYREVLEAFLLAEAASVVDWGGHDRQFAAGQRDVADLYEHWVFLELIRIVEELPGFTVDRRSLITKSKNGLSLGLRRTGRAGVTAIGYRRGIAVRVEVWFNKSFSHSASGGPGTSWTEALRPDCSIRIAPESHALDAETWIHFDAKYRIQNAGQAMNAAEEAEDGAPVFTTTRPMSADVTKMHAYRDAIRRTAGAYVLYPGSDDSDPVDHRAFHEVLPGLGAFVLRPTEDGKAAQAPAALLRSFLDEVIDHVAAQGTAAQRARFWEDRSYLDAEVTAFDFEPALRKPAQDTTVLLGFVRSEEHLAWCQTVRLYNLRADPERDGSVGLSSPELAADIVVLYDAEGETVWTFEASGAVFVRSASHLASTGYPDPRGKQYVCVGLRPVAIATDLRGARVRALASKLNPHGPVGSPVATTWDRLLEAKPE